MVIEHVEHCTLFDEGVERFAEGRRRLSARRG